MDWYLEALKKYAVFEGRSRRKEYWFFGLFNAIFSVVFVIADVFFGTSGGISSPGLLSGVYTLGVFLPALAVLVRRLHDTNRSGWWVLISFLPLSLDFSISVDFSAVLRSSTRSFYIAEFYLALAIAPH